MALLDDYRSRVRGLASLPFDEWASRFAVTAADPWIDGSFSLKRDSREWDLYGLVDMLVCGVTLEPSQPAIRRIDPQAWAQRILSCLDTDGLATRRNVTDHVTEHATAYAYTGLVLLRAHGARTTVPPFRYFASQSFSRTEFESWFRRMGLQCPRWFPGRGVMGSARLSAQRLGWYRFWPGSHVGGGVMATVIMRKQLSDPDGRVPRVHEVPEIEAFVDLANRRLDPRTGVWRPWIARLLSRHASAADVGGAAHFLWPYDQLSVRHPHPEPLLRDALARQRPDGLFGERPSCLDLDFTHAISYAARLGAAPDLHRVDAAMLRNGIAVLEHLLNRARLNEYEDSHGLPGALCAVAQVDAYLRWRGIDAGAESTCNVLSRACWV